MGSTVEKIHEIDHRLLGLRADYMACAALVRACEEAIERLAAFNDVAGDRTRVPSLALARLRNIRDDWSHASDDVSRQMMDTVPESFIQPSAEAIENIA